MKKLKYLLIIILEIISIIFLILNIFNLFGNLNSYELKISDKNKEEIYSLISSEYNNPNEITKIKLKPMLGDGELYLYNNLHLSKKTLISENNSLMQYIIENGSNPSRYYLLKILTLIILIIFLKSILDKQKDTKNSKEMS